MFLFACYFSVGRFEYIHVEADNITTAFDKLLRNYCPLTVESVWVSKKIPEIVRKFNER